MEEPQLKPAPWSALPMAQQSHEVIEGPPCASICMKVTVARVRETTNVEYTAFISSNLKSGYGYNTTIK